MSITSQKDEKSEFSHAASWVNFIVAEYQKRLELISKVFKIECERITKKNNQLFVPENVEVLKFNQRIHHIRVFFTRKTYYI